MRTFEVGLLNEIANEPDVRPWLGGSGPLDLAPIVQDPNNVTFVCELGGYIMHQLEPGTYEVHTVTRRVDNGYRKILSLAHKIVEFMFLETECVEILTKVPKPNAGASMLCDQMRFQEIFVRKEDWKDLEGGVHPVSYRKLDLDRWAAGCSTLATEGAAFHEQLEAAKKAAGSELAIHPDDPNHDRMVGLALKMAKAGNAMKAVNFYNRWARFAGYQPIELRSIVPAIVDIRDAVLQIRRGSVEILLCR